MKTRRCILSFICIQVPFLWLSWDSDGRKALEVQSKKIISPKSPKASTKFVLRFIIVKFAFTVRRAFTVMAPTRIVMGAGLAISTDPACGDVTPLSNCRCVL
ncbi:hypothetical protein J6590_029287 [Homalodisca vitripennis]|nr:hypothetical protein J6590_029287 [Homalodisca vitripennis]